MGRARIWAYVAVAAVTAALAVAAIVRHAATGGPPANGGERLPDGKMLAWGIKGRGNSAVEDLTPCWSGRLAARVEQIGAAGACTDADGDGFKDAWSCPALSADVADCDDHDASVTPTTERYVRSGPFLMGSCSDHAGEDEKPVHVVFLSGYCLDRTEVSAGEFGSFKAIAVAEAQKKRPAQYISFEDADAYCSAHGKRLPTEAQMEKAARGGCELGSDPAACDAADLRPYAWGAAAPSCENANHNFSAQITQSPVVHLCFGDAVDVDRPLNSGPYGNLNLAGNAWEWASDWYHPRVYGDGRQRRDPTGPASGSVHVLRGGGWNTWSTNMRAANRMPANIEASVVGIRCARVPGYKDNPDDVEPLLTVKLSGQVVSGAKTIEGRALYVTAWYVSDLDAASGMPAPGHSPAAEVKLTPSGNRAQPFVIEVEKGRPCLLMTSLDAGAFFRTDGRYASPAVSGGAGSTWPKTFPASEDMAGIEIPLRAGSDVELPKAPPQGQRW